MSGMGTGAGLNALSAGLMNLDEVLRQRKLDEMRQQQIQQQQAMEQQRIQLQAQSQAQEAAERKRQLDSVDQQQGMVRTQANLNQFTPQDQLTPDVVADAQKYGLSGAIRTVGKGQTALPSTRFAGDLSTLSQDPGAVEGMYRRQSPQERQLEDQQAEARQRMATDQQFRESQAAATRASQEEQKERDRQLREDTNRRDNETRRMHDESMGALRTQTAQTANSFRQQGLDIQKERLEVTKGAAAEKANAVNEEKSKKQIQAVGGAQDLKRLADELEAHPGFGRLFGFFDSRTPNISNASRDAQARLDQLKSSLSIEKIMEMKAQSRTGATGFGQLSERELDVLQNAAGRLQQSQTEEAARLALKEIKRAMDTVIQRNGGGQAESGGGGTIPKVGEMYNGKRVLKVERVQ
jgi:hypothetical protein